MKNKNIWITGASSGIGKQLALDLAQNNRVLISSRKMEMLNQVKQSNPNQIDVLPFDLADYHQAKLWVEQAIQQLIEIDILILNGGVSQRSLILDTKIEVDERLIQIDYLANVALAKAILPYFIKRGGGQIVVVTSLLGKFGTPYRSGYAGAKHALHGFFDVLRQEHQKDGIDVTLICPGFVNTQVAFNALNEHGDAQNAQDEATAQGMEVEVFSKKMIRAISQKKKEAYIGQKEIFAVYVKRFFPNILDFIILRSKVR
jgi:short-subunit dehydrogenase